MKLITWCLLASVFTAYAVAVYLLDFPGPVAIGLHFGRVALAVSVLILYIPAITTVFNEVPPPRRDYLLAGILLSWISNIGFSIWNEAGRIYGVDTSIFTSYIAGTFSLILVCGAVFHLVAPDTAGTMKRLTAIVGGVIFAILLVLIVPQFR